MARVCPEACDGRPFGEAPLMAPLVALQKQADELTQEDRESLLAYLIHGLPGAPEGPDDDEVLRRDAELESGAVKAVSHEEFLRQVGRGGK